MNSSVSLNTERVLIDYLTPLFPWASCIIGASDRSNVDEDQYGILGEYVTLPAIVVMVQSLSSIDPTVTGFNGQATVTLRNSAELTTVDTHRRYATALSEALRDQGAIATAFDDTQDLTLSVIFASGESFTREGRKLETVFTLDIIISGKDE